MRFNRLQEKFALEHAQKVSKKIEVLVKTMGIDVSEISSIEDILLLKDRLYKEGIIFEAVERNDKTEIAVYQKIVRAEVEKTWA